MEGEGSSSEMEFTEVETNTDSVDNSVIFRVTKSVIGFVLYMHQQIPSILLDISLEFDTLQTEYKELVAGALISKVAGSSSYPGSWFQCRHVVKGLASKIPTEE